MNKCICDFCKEEIDDIPRFRIQRYDDIFLGSDRTGFDKLDICIDCLRKLKEGSADNE